LFNDFIVVVSSSLDLQAISQLEIVLQLAWISSFKPSTNKHFCKKVAITFKLVASCSSFNFKRWENPKDLIPHCIQNLCFMVCICAFYYMHSWSLCSTICCMHSYCEEIISIVCRYDITCVTCKFFMCLWLGAQFCHPTI
jgi:hypothetical protein